MPIVFNTEPDKSVWREYKKGVRVKMFAIEKKHMRSFRKEAMTRDGINEEKLDQLIYRHIVDEWEGFVDPSGTALPATEKLVDAITSKMINFSAWLLNEATDLTETAQLQMEKELKN